MFAKLNNGQLQKYPYTMGMLRKDNANVSFPKVLDDATLAHFNVVRVASTPRPADDHTKDFNVTAEQVNGAWVEKWVATNVSAEEVTNRTANQANNIRAERDGKLANTDWTQGKDIPDAVSTKWAAYRQALRDVPAQAGFPWDVQWPTQPE
jgi:pyruvoyl-dependent arginine decarboxylase (PvlArgDC)